MPQPIVTQRPHRFSGISQGLQPLQQFFMMRLAQKRADKLREKERDRQIMDQVREHTSQGYEIIDPGVLPEGEKPELQWELSTGKKIGVRKRQIESVDTIPIPGSDKWEIVAFKDKSGKPIKSQLVEISKKATKGKYKIGEIKEFKVGDNIVTRRWTGDKWVDEEVAPRYKPAGTTVNVGAEKFKFQKESAIGELRTNIVKEKDNKSYFESNAPMFNKNNTNNEVAYWDEQEGFFGDSEAKVVKLSSDAVASGWTPAKVQALANRLGKSIKQVLEDIGEIE